MMANYFTLQKGVAIFDVILYQNHSSLKCQLDLLQFIVGVTAMTEGLSDNLKFLSLPLQVLFIDLILANSLSGLCPSKVVATLSFWPWYAESPTS
jgi:hypothetical protein